MTTYRRVNWKLGTCAIKLCILAVLWILYQGGQILCSEYIKCHTESDDALGKLVLDDGQVIDSASMVADFPLSVGFSLSTHCIVIQHCVKTRFISKYTWIKNQPDRCQMNFTSSNTWECENFSPLTSKAILQPIARMKMIFLCLSANYHTFALLPIKSR